MALTSPGSQITIIDESQYLPGAAGPVPLILAPTAQDKSNPSATGTATGTLAANANKLQLVTSQRELATLFGVPNFTTVNGSVVQGDELSEYGLMAAYSFLGVASQAYVMRPDLDLAQLSPSASAPTGEAATNSYWLDLAETSWGILEWNATDQVFSVVAPTLITSTSYMNGALPKASFGKAGDYAISLTTSNIRAYYKGSRSDLSQNWALLGSNDWKRLHPTVSLTPNNAASFTAGDTVFVNGVQLTLTDDSSVANAIAELAALINASSLGTGAEPNMKVIIESGDMVFYSAADVTFGVGNNSDLLDLMSVTDGAVYYAPKLHQAKHTQVPGFKTGSAQPRPTGSVWFHTSTPNNGANVVIKRMSASGSWVTVSSPLYSAGASTSAFDDNSAAIAGLSTDGVTASTIAANAVYMRYDSASDNTFQASVYKWDATGIPLVSDGTTANPVIANGDVFTVKTGGNTYTITVNTGLGDTADKDGLAAAFSRANIPNMSMIINADNTVSISHLTGNDFFLTDSTGAPLAACGISAGLSSNWLPLTYTASAAEPRDIPTNGVLWYNSAVDEVDIMIHDGSAWVGYLTQFPLTDPMGPTVSASEPETQSDGVTALATNDLWIDTSDLENYPVIKRRTASGTWETVNNTDQTSEAGVLFADARYRVNGTSTGSSDIADLLNSSYLDLDAPSAALYPEGMLLFNTRRSGYNVKEYKANYFNATDFANLSLPSFKDAWVSKVGTKSDGSPYMGRKAQRRVIVEALQAGLGASLEARAEQNDFSIIACPGYPELADEMITLNTDRKGTAFVIIDPPFRLAPTGDAIKNWATNANGAPSNGEDGLTSLNEYAAVFYPNAYTSNLSGQDVMVPASHIMLRTIALNDQVAYPWFAPAGLRRGVVNNATSVGYLSAEGEFVSAPLGQGVRDVMYPNRVNPIVIQPNGGIVVFGQKTLSISATALDRINVARLIVYIRKQLEVLVKPYFFEPNDTITRNEVKQDVEGFFNELVGQRALYDFLVVCDSSNNTPERIDRNELWIDIAIKPVKAIEFIYIPIRIKNTGEALA